MGGRGSGGHNRLTPEEHRLRGTFRPDRHAERTPDPPSPISAADRRRALAGLGSAARVVATRLLDTFDEWDEAGIQTLRAYALSCVRLEAAHAAGDAVEARREIRVNLMLLKALELPR